MTTSSSDSGAQSKANETTPLLVPPEVPPTAQPGGSVIPTRPDSEPGDWRNDNEDDDGPPLQKAQIIWLCCARLAEPVAFFSIFPYVNQMIADTGEVPETDVGFYSGLIESLFSLTQMLLMIPWGRAADRVGRKPILVSSLCGLSIATSLFGLSKNVWQMIALRCLAGVFGGSVVTIRAMITEHSTRRTQARAFSFFAFASNLGIFIGPLLGGALANPAKQYPSVFGHIQLFKEYPYILPSIASGVIAACGTIVSFVFVEETLKKRVDEGGVAKPPMSTWDIIKSPGVKTVLYIYGNVQLLGLGYTAIYIVYLFTPVPLGGLGFTPLKISLFIGAGGLLQAIWGLLIFPPLQNKVGTGGILRFMTLIWAPEFLVHPLGNVLLKHNFITAFWVLAALLILVGSSLSMAFVSAQLALNDIAPSPETLGTLNAIGLSLISGIRAIAPGLFSSIYAAGIRHQIVDGYLGWIVLAAMVLPVLVVVRYLPLKAEGKLKPRQNAA